MAENSAAGRAAKRIMRSRLAQGPFDVLDFDSVDLRDLGNLHSVSQPSPDARDVRSGNFAGRGFFVPAVSRGGCGIAVASYGRFAPYNRRRGGLRRHRNPVLGSRANGRHRRFNRSRFGSEQCLGCLTGLIGTFAIIRVRIAWPGSVICWAVGRMILSHSSSER